MSVSTKLHGITSQDDLNFNLMKLKQTMFLPARMCILLEVKYSRVVKDSASSRKWQQPKSAQGYF
jgi:hypothetical protein